MLLHAWPEEFFGIASRQGRRAFKLGWSSKKSWCQSLLTVFPKLSIALVLVLLDQTLERKYARSVVVRFWLMNSLLFWGGSRNKMKSFIRYSLQDAFGLFSLILLSTGLAHLADTAAGAALDCLGTAIDAMEDGIATMVGGLSIENRIFFVKLGINRVVSGLLLSCLVVGLVLLRYYWATLVAFSLPFSVLFIECLRFWMCAIPATTETAPIVGKTALLSAILAAYLFSFCVYCTRRIPGSRLRIAAAHSERPRWQRLLLVAAFATYLFSCAFGWYEMASVRAGMIEARDFWEHIGD